MLHLHRPTAIGLQVILNHFIKRVLYISHGYKFPLKFALREPSPAEKGDHEVVDEEVAIRMHFTGAVCILPCGTRIHLQ